MGMRLHGITTEPGFTQGEQKCSRHSQVRDGQLAWVHWQVRVEHQAKLSRKDSD